MADTTLEIGARDKGALRLIADLVRALTGLDRASKAVGGSRAAVRASRDTAQALREQLAIAKQLVINRQQEVNALRKLGDQRVADDKAETARLIASAKQRQNSNNQDAKSATETATRRLQEAKQAVQNEIQSQAKLVQAVSAGVEKRIAAEKKATQSFDAAAQARILAEQTRLRKLIDARDKEKALFRQSIADEQKKKNLAEELRKIAPAGPARVAAKSEVALRSQNLKDLREAKKLSADRAAEQITTQRKILADEKALATTQSKVRQENLAKSIAAGKKEVASAQKTSNDIIAAVKTRVTSRQTEVTDARKNATTIAANGRTEVAAIKKTGQTTAESVVRQNKANNERTSNALRGARTRVTNLRTETSAAQRAAREQERAFNRASAALRRQGSAIPGLDAGMRRLRSTVLQLVSAYAGFRVIEGFIARGLRFNQLIESSRLGIASLITASADLIDTNGKLLTGTTALASAQSLASDQLDKLRIAGIQTSATTEELVTTFQEAVGAGLAVGLTLDQIRKFSVSVAQAATAINLPMNQLQQETRSILQGTIDRNSRIAKTLNLTNAEVNLAKQQNRLYDLLNEKFKAFNIAGIEAVKTFSALKSNLQDAFSVFAGITTQPLFEDLRNAGQTALARIFDFDTAKIRDNFQGLIAGLQTLFDQIGQVFSGAIRTAVDRAEDLSRWIEKNRQTVRETATAIATMVEEFGKMVIAIGKGIAEMLSLGQEVNTVTGAARVLAAAFQAVADNVKIIVALITGRALIGSLTKLAAIIGGVRAAGAIGAGFAARAAAGAAAGTAAGGPGLGALVFTIIALSAGYKLLKGNQQQARIEAARLGSELDAQRQRAIPLVEEFVRLTRAMDQQNITKEETAALDKQLESTQNNLIELDKSYAAIIGEGTGSLKERRKALLDLLSTQSQVAAIQEIEIQEREKALKAEQQNIQKTLKAGFDTAAGGFVIGESEADKLKARLQAIQEELQVTGAELDVATARTDAFSRAFKRVGEEPAKIRARTPKTDTDAGEPQFVRQARANLERIKAEIEAQQAVAKASFERGSITQIQLIHFVAATELAALQAEEKLIEALEKKAKEDLAKAKKSKDEAAPGQVADANDALKALETERTALIAKRTTLEADADREIFESEKATAKQREEIEIAYLRAIGKHLEAAQREIRLKHEEGIREAIREFGQAIPDELKAQIAAATGPELRALLDRVQAQLPKMVLKAKIGLDRAALSEELDAIEDQIKQAEEQRNREAEATRAKFSALGKLSDQEKQQQLDELAASNQRANQTLSALRGQLEILKASATDSVIISFIDTLLARLDAIRQKAEEVDVQARKLREGFRDALESGIAGFFQVIADGSEASKDSFKKMVKSIIDDMRRLVSEMIASSIIQQIFGIAAGAAVGSAGGQTRGNTTQSMGRARGGLAQGRAEGGPARPKHGVLHGGTPGKDSIPISAMPDEYFIRREATKKYGANFLDLINQMRLPLTWTREMFSLMHTHFTPRPIRPRTSFAQGGLVGRAGGGARPVMRQEVTHVIGVDQNGLLTFIQGKKVREVVLGHVGSAPRFVGNLSRQLKRV